MKTASRTLVKSPPEVWEQLDHPERMEGLMSALVGHATDVEVYERVEESKLAWKAGDEARIEVELAEKGWGTNVSVSAENGGEPTKLEGWLDAVLDELATPQKRPFGGMTEAPAGTLAEAFTSKPAPPRKGPPVQQTEQTVPEQAEPEQVEVDEAHAEEPADPIEEEKPKAAPTPQPEPPRKKKRLFGLF
jgi:hypothetical protein